MPGFLVIPSIDIKDGKTVRVVQGIPELNCPEYNNDPVETALLWRAENAKCIHVVDFDAALNHSHKNFEIINEICESVIIPVQLGGGIRSFDDAKEAMELGVFRLIVGSLAFEKPEEFKKIIETFSPGKIVAAIDIINEEVVTHGRLHKTGMHFLDYAEKLKNLGAGRFLVTDVKRNGMLSGPNLELSKKVADITGGKVTLSGGVGNVTDLWNVRNAEKDGIDSVVIGRAFYENRFSCMKIWRVAESGLFN